MSRSRIHRFAVLLILGSIALAACAPSQPPPPRIASEARVTSASTSSNTQTNTQPAAPQSTTVAAAPAQSQPQPAQPASSAAVVATEKPQFIEFYSTLCAICKQIQPTLYDLQDEYQDRVTFKAYDVAGIDNDIKTRYQFIGYPQIVMINSQGEIIFSRLGFQTYDSLKTDLEAVLKSSRVAGKSP